MVGVSLHQPNFIPWTKLLAKVAASDVYVAYDSVQFTRTEYHNRQRLRSRAGTVLLTAPVRKARSRQRLCDVQLDRTASWRGYHLRIIEQEYRRAPYFADVFALLSEVYQGGQELLVDFNLDLLRALCGYLDYSTTIVKASDLPHAGDNTERLIQLTDAVGGDEHITSTWGTDRKYIDWDRVSAAGIKIRTQEFRHPRYQQQFDPFEPDLGVLDLLFAQGRAAARTVQISSEFPYAPVRSVN
jgi:WbqC-like protein family